MRRVVIVFAGGGIGSVGRAIVLNGLAPWSGSLPLPILIVNILGAFILGTIYVLADEVELLRAETRLFLGVGVLGGFTTFSTFGWGVDLLVTGGSALSALAYAAASIGGGVIAVALGLAAGREIVRGLERLARAVLVRFDTDWPRPSGVRQDMAAIETENREEPA